MVVMLDEPNARLESLATDLGGHSARNWDYEHPLPLLPQNSRLVAWLHPVEAVNLSGLDIDLEELRAAVECGPEITVLNLNDNPRVTDEAIPMLNSLRSLARLSIAGTSITPSGAKQLEIAVHGGTQPVIRDVYYERLATQPGTEANIITCGAADD